MRFSPMQWGTLIAGVTSIAVLGCGRTGSGSTTANSGGTPSETNAGGSTGSAGMGGVTSDSTPATGTLGGTGGGSGGASLGPGGQNGTGGMAGGSGTTGSGGGNSVSGGATGTGGLNGSGGALALDGGSGTGGLGGSLAGMGGAATGGSTSPNTGTMTMDCKAPMPGGGTPHSENNSRGAVGNLAWSFWENGTGASMTTFSTAAFSASWGPDSGDVLARIGLDWGDSGKTYDQYGAIVAQFAETKSGSAGGYSYIGVYGMTVNPCVEFYIVDDSYDAMPIKPYVSSNVGSAKIDGETYTFWKSAMTGAGDAACDKTGWSEYHSVRQTARTCGQISVTEHFAAWRTARMALGTLVELRVFMEAGGGTGRIDFPIANITIQ